MSRWLLGYPDQALATVHDAYRLVEELRHPLTTTITRWFVAWVQYQRGERAAAAETAARLVALAEAHGFRNWIDAGILLSHAAAKERIDPDMLTELHRRLMEGGTATFRRVFLLCVLAELCADAGRPEQGRSALASIAEADRQMFYAPEVYRIEGELLMRTAAPDAHEAERCFRAAIDIARRRAEKSLELRAAISLARLWQQQGKREEARGVLADVYGWFTEGFETRDLTAAKALLKDLEVSRA
jgi:tetratricopeptide (TPR) repeat protein